MNYYQDELTAKYNRQKVRKEFKQDRLAQLADKSHARRPSLLAWSMNKVANWKILSGKRLRKQHKIPVTDSK